MVSRLAPFQHAFVQRLSELGIAYRGSPIVEGAGERYFDESLRGGDGIRSRFLLLCDRAGLNGTSPARRIVSRHRRAAREAPPRNHARPAGRLHRVFGARP